jgi:hypothetical protein
LQIVGREGIAYRVQGGLDPHTVRSTEHILTVTALILRRVTSASTSWQSGYTREQSTTASCSIADRIQRSRVGFVAVVDGYTQPQAGGVRLMQRTLTTRRGKISFPAYIPVTTFGEKYPLDKLVQPYLPRLAPAAMVSYYYAKEIVLETAFRIPLLVDSGGFATLFADTQLYDRDGLGVLEISKAGVTEILHPRDVLELQEAIADVAFTLDFPIPPKLDADEALRRQRLTITNAHWALANRRRRDLPLFACIQAWDVDSLASALKLTQAQDLME